MLKPVPAPVDTAKGEHDCNQGTAARARRRLDHSTADGQWVARVTMEDGKHRTYYAKIRKDVTAKLKAA